jgi:hypothetical protein
VPQLDGQYVVKQHKRARVGKQEQGRGHMYTSRLGVFSYIWVLAVILFHSYLLVYLLYAAFRRMASVPNSIWDVVAESLAPFLVVTLDDAVLYCVLKHPITIRALEPLAIQVLPSKKRRQAWLVQKWSAARQHPSESRADDCATTQWVKCGKGRSIFQPTGYFIAHGEINNITLYKYCHSHTVHMHCGEQSSE